VARVSAGEREREMRTARVYGRERERERWVRWWRGGGEEEEEKEKKKGRPFLLDVQKQKRTHSACTCPNPDDEELDSDDSVNDDSVSDDSASDYSVTDESEIEREMEAYRRNGRARGLTDEELVRYEEQVYKSDVSKIYLLRLLRLYIYIYTHTHTYGVM
jgi:hypothetical protein